MTKVFLIASDSTGAVAPLTLIGVVSLYLCALVGLGWLGHIRSRSGEEDYYLAGRDQGWFVSTLTIMASFLSAFALLGAPGMAYREGVVFALVSLNIPVAGFCIILLGPQIRRIGKAGNHVTQADMICDYYRSPIALRLLVPLIGTIFVLPYVIIQIKAGGDVAAAMFRHHDHAFSIGAIVIAVVLAFYIMVGGMRSVMWADALQCLLLLGGLLVASVAMIASFGGVRQFSEAIAALPASSLTVPGNTGMWRWPFLLSVCLLMPIGGILQPAQWMRFYAARDTATLRRGGIIFIVVITAAFLFCIVPIGLGGQSLYPLQFTEGKVSPAAEVARFDQVLVVIAQKQFANLLGPAWGGVMISLVAVAILAAAMSTANGCLHALSAMVTRDLFDRFLRPNASEREKVWIGRAVILAGTVFSLAVVLLTSRPASSLAAFMEMIVELAMFAVAFSVQLLPMTLDMLIIRRGTRQGAIAGLVAGLVVALAFTPLFGMVVTALGSPEWLTPVTDLVAACRAVLPVDASAWGLAANFCVMVTVSGLTKLAGSRVSVVLPRTVT